MKENAVNIWTKLKSKILSIRLPKYEAVFSICLLLLPLTVQYTSPISIISFGELALIIILGYGFLKEAAAYWAKFRASKGSQVLIEPKALGLNPISKSLLTVSFVFVYLTCITSIYSTEYFEWSESFTIICRMVMYFFVVMFATKYFDIKSVEKLYLVIVYLLAAYLFVQVIYYYAAADSANRYLPIYLKFDWLYYAERRTVTQTLSNYYEGGYWDRFRPSSLFMEPNYYAFFVMPALYYMVLKKKQPLPSLFLYASIVLSTSGAGLLMGAFVYLIYMIESLAEKKDGKLRFNVVPCVCFAVAVIAAIIYFKIDPSRINHAFDSYEFRVVRAFRIFNDLDLFHKFFGVGMNNVGTYGNFYDTWFKSYPNEGGSFSVFMAQYGILGSMIFIGFYADLLFNCRYRKLAFFFVVFFIIYTITDSNMFNSRMGCNLALVCYFYRIESETVEKKPLRDCLLC